MRTFTTRRPLALSFQLVVLLLVAVSWAQEDKPAPPSPPQDGPSASEPQRVAEHSSQKNSPSTPNWKEEAWHTLELACLGDKTSDRANATRALGLIPNDRKAARLAERGISDSKPEVREAAAAALGEMPSRRSIPTLKKALDDQDPSVALAAANSLRLMHSKSAFQLYSAVLSKEKKTQKGLISSQLSILHDPKKMAQLGFEEGIGFVPFGSIGWTAIKEVRKDDSSPIRAAAAKVLADDPDPDTTKLLEDAIDDKSWIVRTAALEAVARRGDSAALAAIQLHLADDNEVVRYTAAAAIIRLTAKVKTRPNRAGKPIERAMK